VSDTKALSWKTVEFLRELKANNHKAWFEGHRQEYDTHYVKAGVELVETLGPRLRKFSKSLCFVAKQGGSLSRIHRDVRFSKDKAPYKTHLDAWFWESETGTATALAKKTMETTGFFLRLGPTQLVLGAGIYLFTPERLQRYCQAVVLDRSGEALSALLAQAQDRGFALGGATKARVPKGFDKTHPRADLLKREGLHVAVEVPVPKNMGTPTFYADCVRRFERAWPLSQWFLQHGIGGMQRPREGA
jgi:uncharacterized protein (TIGR02453 family)